MRVTPAGQWREVLLLTQPRNAFLSNLPNRFQLQPVQTGVVSHPFHRESCVDGGFVMRNLLWADLLLVEQTRDWLNETR